MLWAAEFLEQLHEKLRNNVLLWTKKTQQKALILIENRKEYSSKTPTDK